MSSRLTANASRDLTTAKQETLNSFAGLVSNETRNPGLTISSTERTSYDQARIMYANYMANPRYQRSLYGAAGQKVLDYFDNHRGQSREALLTGAGKYIDQLTARGYVVSRHLGAYQDKNNMFIFDIGYNGLASKQRVIQQMKSLGAHVIDEPENGCVHVEISRDKVKQLLEQQGIKVPDITTVTPPDSSILRNRLSPEAASSMSYERKASLDTLVAAIRKNTGDNNLQVTGADRTPAQQAAVMLSNYTKDPAYQRSLYGAPGQKVLDFFDTNKTATPAEQITGATTLIQNMAANGELVSKQLGDFQRNNQLFIFDIAIASMAQQNKTIDYLKSIGAKVSAEAPNGIIQVQMTGEQVKTINRAYLKPAVIPMGNNQPAAAPAVKFGI